MASDPNEPEPAPTPNTGPPVWDLVIEDMRAKGRLGKYPICTGIPYIGIDPLVDAYQAVLDLSVCLRQLVEERGKPPRHMPEIPPRPIHWMDVKADMSSALIKKPAIVLDSMDEYQAVVQAVAAFRDAQSQESTEHAKMRRWAEAVRIIGSDARVDDRALFVEGAAYEAEYDAKRRRGEAP